MSVDAAAVACARRVSYSEVLRVPQFRAVFLAQLLSLLGDRAAAVALAVLVYDRSGSPVLTATVFALTFCRTCSRPHSPRSSTGSPGAQFSSSAIWSGYRWCWPC